MVVAVTVVIMVTVIVFVAAIIVLFMMIVVPRLRAMFFDALMAPALGGALPLAAFH